MQLNQISSIATSFNVGSSVMRALDFSIDIDDEDLFPAVDLPQKNQRSGSKIASQRSTFN